MHLQCGCKWISGEEEAEAEEEKQHVLYWWILRAFCLFIPHGIKHQFSSCNMKFSCWSFEPKNIKLSDIWFTIPSKKILKYKNRNQTDDCSSKQNKKRNTHKNFFFLELPTPIRSTQGKTNHDDHHNNPKKNTKKWVHQQWGFTARLLISITATPKNRKKNSNLKELTFFATRRNPPTRTTIIGNWVPAQNQITSRSTYSYSLNTTTTITKTHTSFD